MFRRKMLHSWLRRKDMWINSPRDLPVCTLAIRKITSSLTWLADFFFLKISFDYVHHCFVHNHICMRVLDSLEG